MSRRIESQRRGLERESGGRSLSESVASQIRDWILSGTYGPGEKLPPERHLASLLGVNRGSLRQALTRLEMLGLLRSRQGDGTRVQDLGRAGSLELLPFLFREFISRQPQVLRDVLELRVMIGTYLVGLAAAAEKTDRDLGRISDLVAKIRAEREPRELLRLDFDIFWEYARIGNSLVGQLLVNTLRTPYELHSAPFECMAADRVRMAEAVEAIAAAVERGEVERAKSLAEAYLRGGTRKALESFAAKVTSSS